MKSEIRIDGPELIRPVTKTLNLSGLDVIITYIDTPDGRKAAYKDELERLPLHKDDQEGEYDQKMIDKFMDRPIKLPDDRVITANEASTNGGDDYDHLLAAIKLSNDKVGLIGSNFGN